MTIVADASSLILLAKASVLETFAKRNKVITSKLVYGEVIRGKTKGRGDSMLVEKLVQKGILEVKLPKTQKKSKIEKLFNLKAGELETVSLAQKNDTILTDDKKCLNASKALGIDFITSLDVIVALQKKRIISKEKALECIDSLEEYGWYSRNLIKYYREVIG